MALKEKLDRILRSHVVTSEDAEVRNKLLAAGFVLANKDGVIYSNAAGRLDFPTSAAPYTTSSISWIASMTKLITSTCLLQLVEKSLLTLGEDLRLRVPQLAQLQILRGFDPAGKPMLEPNIRPITLRHLLTHTVGLAYDLVDADLTRWSEAVGRTANNLDWSLDGFTTPLKFAPGDGWLYGTALDWAGLVLVAVTGQPLSAYLQENVLTPLGMDSTTFSPGEIAGSAQRTLAFAFASEDEPSGDTLLTPGASPLPAQHSMESAGAGLFSTPADYGRFLHGMLTYRVLSRATVDLAFAPQLDDAQRAMMRELVDAARDGYVPEFPCGAPLDYSLVGAINVEDIEGKRRAGSAMWSGMTNGRWWIDRQTGIAAAIFTNVLPHGNKLLADLWAQLEGAVYEEFLA